MGEYAKYDGDRIKIGTCEEMYYLRYEDRKMVRREPGNLDAAKELNLFWRLPLPAEDDCGPGGYQGPKAAVELRRGNEWFRSPKAAEHFGEINMTHPCGYTIPVPCYHGEKLPGSGAVEWQGGTPGSCYELVSVKNTADGVKPVIQCRHCGNRFRAEWSEVLEWIPDAELRARLAKHDAQEIPAASSPGYPGECPEGMDWSRWLAMNNVD